jgi:hypothetical protein
MGKELASHDDLRMSGRGDVWIDATTADVYAAVSDLPRMGRWSPENRGGEWIDASGAEVGAMFRGRNVGPTGEFETILTVIEAEAPRSFGFRVAPPGAVGTVWRYVFEPVGEGTLVVETFDWYWTAEPVEGFRGRVGRLPLADAAAAVEDRRAHLLEGVGATLGALKKDIEGRS